MDTGFADYRHWKFFRRQEFVKDIFLGVSSDLTNRDPGVKLHILEKMRRPTLVYFAIISCMNVAPQSA